MPLVLRTDAERPIPPLLREILRERGWVEYDHSIGSDEQPPWSLWWRSSRPSAAQIALCRYPYQRLNHFPKTDEITKKDTLLRNIRRMRSTYGQSYNFLPVTFSLPGDHGKFVEEWGERQREGRSSYWICKPSEMSRGRKIYVFRELAELRYDCPVVVQQYVERPLLFAGYKFDLRLYVLVTSYQPLRVYIYRDYMVRFSTEKYDLGDLGNLCSHLTNTSLNKRSSGAGSEKDGIGTGCKWDGAKFDEYLSAVGVAPEVIWVRIENVIILTLLSIAGSVPPSSGCFELYGFDLLLDQSFKPWLLEVNFSPALQIDGPVDEIVKRPLVADMIDVLQIPEDTVRRRSFSFRSRPSTSSAESRQVLERLRQTGRDDRRRRPPPPRGTGASLSASAGQQRAQTPQTVPPVSVAAAAARRPPTSHGTGPARLAALRGDTVRPLRSSSCARPRPSGPVLLGASFGSRSRDTASISHCSSPHTPAAAAPAADECLPSADATGVAAASAARPQYGPHAAQQLVDAPSGNFACSFPFNDQTAAASLCLGHAVKGDRDEAMRVVIYEIRRREHKARERCKRFPALHAAYEARRAEQGPEESAATPPARVARKESASDVRRRPATFSTPPRPP
eukprot:TRINITY_DN38_c0_g1_i6.p1 TRINITY_DN38_c0_g1~~TRINITY_DN38_c0_g1_i6.p1  ORF type:complete len:672 (+),score=197.74 TRINITY_DN38_c0_g1_i6:151-2016(+)